MFVTPEQLAAMMFAVSARPNTQLVYTGSAVALGDGIQFGALRESALSDNPPDRLFWAEWSAKLHSEYCEDDCDEHDDPGDPEVWKKCNPGYGHRPGLKESEVQDEWDSFKNSDPEEFYKERLGIGKWPSKDEQWAVIGKDEWMARSNEESQITGDQLVFAVETSPDLK